MRQFGATAVLSVADQPQHQDYGHQYRQHIAHIATHPALHFQSLAGVGLFGKVLLAPAVAGGAEENKDERAQRQQQIAHHKVLQIQHAGARTQRLELGEHIEP